jgi:hypothetical protein
VICSCSSRMKESKLLAAVCTGDQM